MSGSLEERYLHYLQEEEWDEDKCKPDILTFDTVETGFDSHGCHLMWVEGRNSIGVKVFALFDDGGFVGWDEITINMMNATLRTNHTYSQQKAFAYNLFKEKTQ